jgi:thiol-disulfide isomerase/thioredoxin
MSKRFLVLTSLWLLAFAAIWFFTDWESAKNKVSAESGVAVGQKMMEFTLPALDKKEVVVKNSGKPIVINFFATWCPPCKDEMPDLDKFVKKYKGEVDFYAVNIQESPAAVAEFMDKNKYDFKDELLFDDGKVARAFRVNAIPTTVITDKNGVIRNIKLGAVTLEQLENFLKELPK